MQFKIATKAVQKVGPVVGKAMLKVRKYSPEIMIGVGVVGVGACVFMACKATMKLEDVIDEHAAAVDDVKNCPEGTPKKEYNREMAKVYFKTGAELTKLYLPSACVGAVSIACICGAHGIMLKRVAGLTAAYTAVDEAFKDYRSRVVERYGEDVDRELRYGFKEELVTSTETDENGNIKTILEQHTVVDNTGHSQYAKFFDQSCGPWEKDPEYNLMFLCAQQEFFNNRLKAIGHVFLNEVYDALGIQRTQAGQVVGWVVGNGDGFIDLGIYRGKSEADRRFLNGLENVFLIDPNVDGVIIDKI